MRPALKYGERTASRRALNVGARSSSGAVVDTLERPTGDTTAISQILFCPPQSQLDRHCVLGAKRTLGGVGV